MENHFGGRNGNKLKHTSLVPFVHKYKKIGPGLNQVFSPLEQALQQKQQRKQPPEENQNTSSIDPSTPDNDALTVNNTSQSTESSNSTETDYYDPKSPQEESTQLSHQTDPVNNKQNSNSDDVNNSADTSDINSINISVEEEQDSDENSDDNVENQEETSLLDNDNLGRNSVWGNFINSFSSLSVHGFFGFNHDTYEQEQDQDEDEEAAPDILTEQTSQQDPGCCELLRKLFNFG